VSNLIAYKLHAQTREFKKKLKTAVAIIEKSYRAANDWSISCSYGKDSIVLLHLIYQFKKPDVIYKDNGYALPCIYETKEKLEKLLKYETNVLKQEFDFVEFLKEYGLPDITRDMMKQDKIVKIIKKDPLSENNKSVFWGLRAKESKKRTALFKYRGAIYYNDNRKKHFSAPLWDWSDRDVWAYIAQYNVPYPDLYDKENFGFTREKLRNSSWITTDGAKRGRVAWLRFNYPEFYNKLAKEFPIITSYV